VDSLRTPLRARQPTARDMVYWVFGEKKGKRLIMGYYQSQTEAEEDGFRKFQDNYTVYPMHTIDRAEASRIIRKKVLDETNDIEDAFKKFSHPEKYQEGN